MRQLTSRIFVIKLCRTV